MNTALDISVANRISSYMLIYFNNCGKEAFYVVIIPTNYFVDLLGFIAGWMVLCVDLAENL